MRLPESEILAFLTRDGRDPLDLCFALRGSIMRWDPRSGMMMGCLIDDALLADDSWEYLYAKGQLFITAEELERHVLAHNWPNLEKLLPQIEHMKRREAERKAGP